MAENKEINYLFEFGNWLINPKTINGIKNVLLNVISVILILGYTFISVGYDITKVFTMATVINILFINGTMIIVKYSINDWCIARFRLTKEYLNEINEISTIKRDIEFGGFIRQLQIKIDSMNKERKQRAYLKKVNNDIYELDKELLKTKKEKDIINIEKQIQELEYIKYNILHNKIDINGIHIKYNILTRANLFAGSNIEDDRDVDISDTVRNKFLKSNLKVAVIFIFIVAFARGITQSILEETNFVLLAIFLGIYIFNIISTYSFTLFLEKYETIPKTIVRKQILLEFMDEITKEGKE